MTWRDVVTALRIRVTLHRFPARARIRCYSPSEKPAQRWASWYQPRGVPVGAQGYFRIPRPDYLFRVEAEVTGTVEACATEYLEWERLMSRIGRQRTR